MGKFNVALLWLGAPVALNFGGLLPWWGVVTWMLSPFIAIALLRIGAGTIAAGSWTPAPATAPSGATAPTLPESP